MSRIKTFILLIGVILMNETAIAQVSQTSIALLFDSLNVAEADSAKRSLNQQITRDFQQLLSQTDSYEANFDSLRYIGKIYANDRSIKVYTWNYPLGDKSYEYGGFIQKKEKDKTITIPLKINGETYIPYQSKRIPANQWYGCLYYKVVHIKKKRDDYYILLGWARNDAISAFKVIETLTFTGNKNITFGKPVFPSGRGTVSRIVLEYSAEGKVALSYDERSHRIIFDHLVPTNPIYTGIRAYYGPDFTYDAYTYQKGKWIFEENIDARNQ